MMNKKTSVDFSAEIYVQLFDTEGQTLIFNKKHLKIEYPFKLLFNYKSYLYKKQCNKYYISILCNFL